MKKWGFRIVAVAFAIYAVLLASDVNVSWGARAFMAIAAIWTVALVFSMEWYDRGGYKSTPAEPEDDDPGDEITKVVWRAMNEDDYRRPNTYRAPAPRQNGKRR